MGKLETIQRLSERRNSMEALPIDKYEDVILPKAGPVHVPVVKGQLHQLPKKVQEFIAENVALCKPRGIYICDGTDDEAAELTTKLTERGTLTKLEKMDNCVFDGIRISPSCKIKAYRRRKHRYR